MSIFVQTLLGKIIEISVEPSDTIGSIKSRLPKKEVIPDDRICLIYSGKVLDDARDLSAYHIEPRAILHLVLPRADSTETSTVPNESVFRDRHASKASIQAWKERPKQGHFDDNICIIDPQAYYSNLSWLESDVVKTSEFLHGKGAYGDAFANKLEELTLRHAGMPTIPDWMWQLILASSANNFEASWKLVQEPLASLWTTYLIFCRVLASFDALSQAGFCTSYYSILLEHPGTDVVEIVKIRRDVLGTIMTRIETVTAQICNGEVHPNALHDFLHECVRETCSLLLWTFSFPPEQSLRSATSNLALCRTISLVADLGLVSYAGSHATRFDLDHLHRETPMITIHDGDTGSVHVDFRLRRLACLNEFLDEEKVWVFRYSPRWQEKLHQNDDPGPGLSVLTHIEEFADIWGPVWSIPADQKSSGLIQQHNVSKGVICRVDEATRQKGKAVRCHWYSWASFRRRRAKHLVSLSKPLHLEGDDLLLIGTHFRVNQSCNYTLDQFEEEHGHGMGVLGAERSVWEQELDSRSGGLSVSKIVGVSVSGTQKRRPQTSLKQLMLAKWKTAPQTANPGILNQYLGVEISHCTGNAQRVRVKDLLLMQSVRLMLDLHFPGWSSLPWGIEFLMALQSDDTTAVFDVWIRYESNRCEIAALVCWVLEALETTGKGGHGLVAAFLNNRRESSITFDNSCNDWSNLLQDSHLMATYAIVNNKCLECYIPDRRTATCDSELAYTVLGTRLCVLPGHPLEPPDSMIGHLPGQLFRGLNRFGSRVLVKMQPQGQFFKTIGSLEQETLLMVRDANASFRATLLSRPVPSAVEIRDLDARGGQHYDIILRSTNKSHSGKKSPRRRIQSQQAEPGTRITSPKQTSGTSHEGQQNNTEIMSGSPPGSVVLVPTSQSGTNVASINSTGSLREPPLHRNALG